jgi:hypothetical protein
MPMFWWLPAKLFWALIAQQGLIAYDADVSNAFAEVPPPQHPFYMCINEAFCE